MSNLNLKGVWIPIEILADNKLSDKENSNKWKDLEKEKNHLYKIINKFWNTLEKFIS